MLNSATSNDALADAGLITRRPLMDEATFDITAMIDLVFMMNIYFLVTMVTAGMAEVNLPAARHCLPADPDVSVILTVFEGPEGEPAVVFLGNGREGRALSTIEEQEQEIRALVEDGVRAQKNTVLVKAERNVRLRDIARIGAVAGAVPGTDLKLAVLEKE